MPRPCWADGMRQIIPGVYSDGAGGLHLSEAELLGELGWVNTPETRAALEEAAADYFRVDGMSMSVMEHERGN